MWPADPDKIYPSSIKFNPSLISPSLLKCGRVGSTLLAVEMRSLPKLRVFPALAMHDGLREQMYTGSCGPWDPFTRLHKLWTEIPFIANGDIRTVQDANNGSKKFELMRHDWSRCYGHPYLFNQINHYFEQEESCLIWLLKTRWRLLTNIWIAWLDLKGEHKRSDSEGSPLRGTRCSQIMAPSPKLALGWDWSTYN